MTLTFATKTGGSLTKKVSIFNTGEACFACTICAPSIVFCSSVNSGYAPIKICNPNPGSSAFSELSFFNNTSNQAGFFYNSSARSGDGGVCSFSMYNDSANGNIQVRAGSCIILGTGSPVGNRLIVTPTGNILPGANGTQDLGSSSLRWCTVYTSDLSLNNGIGNYTIVEGESDLFLYNNNSCKVFKFLLQEVCPEIAPAKRST
jgi:hypothetical protein